MVRGHHFSSTVYFKNRQNLFAKLLNKITKLQRFCEKGQKVKNGEYADG